MLFFSLFLSETQTDEGIVSDSEFEPLDELDELDPIDTTWLPEEQDADVDCSTEHQQDKSNLTTQEVDDEYEKQGDDAELNR